MEPVTWGVLAASTATWSIKKLASLAGGTAWKEKVERRQIRQRILARARQEKAKLRA